MRIEPGGNDDQIRVEGIKFAAGSDCRGPRGMHPRHHRGESGAFTILPVLATITCRASTRIERHFRASKHRAHPDQFQKMSCVPVAMMHIPIDDRDAPGPMMVTGPASRHSGMVEEAETHRNAVFSVMARRAHGAEGVTDLAGHHLVYRLHRAPGPAQRRFHGPGGEDRVRINLHQPAFRRGLEQGIHIAAMIARVRLSRYPQPVPVRERAARISRPPESRRPPGYGRRARDARRACRGRVRRDG